MLDSRHLLRRMEDAVVEDARIKAVDAAKKRAVAQRCDVDTFFSLVSAAHLQPMRGRSGLRITGGVGGKPAAPRCFAADGSILAPAAAAAAARENSSSSKAPADEALRSGAQWARAWRSTRAPADRLQLLVRAGQAGSLSRLLRLELSTRLLEEILSCLEWGVEQDAASGAAVGTEHPQEGSATAGMVLAPAGAQPAADASWTPGALAAEVLQAAAGASGFAVARAGLSPPGQQLLARLAGEHKAEL